MKRKSLTKQFLSIVTIFTAIALFPSCRKFIEIPPPANSIVTSQIFADSTDATAALNGIYISMVGNGVSLNVANGATTVFTGFSSDELYNPANNPYYQEFVNNAITTTNPSNNSLWSTAYPIIYEANACIEGVASATALSQSLRDRITGEAKFIRAYIYFYMLNLYGPVPLILSTDYKVNASISRTPVDQIYTQILADLTDAQKLLNADKLAITKTRVNRFTVNAFLARVNLYQQQWAGAEAAASTVISSSYKLEPSLANIFLTGNQEQIWQMTPVVVGNETTEGQFILPSYFLVAPQIAVTPSLMAAFETNDQRKVQWVKSFTLGNITYTYPFKYKLGRDNNTAPKEAYSMLRLAEQYLIRSEARAQQNNLSGAISDLNIIRNRAGLSNTTAATQQQILDAIQRERRIEFCFEWGHRWLDLKRTQTINSVLGISKPGWKTTATLFPIPYNELLLNPALTQNSGY